MNRRAFCGSALALAGCAAAAIPRMKIRRIRYYQPPRVNPTFNQSNRIVTIETDAGITGLGEGGSRDMMEQCASMLIGEDPTRIDHLWQMMYRGWFYPPGREKLHALGALDMALWDIKGKALGVPVYQLLGGLSREHIECYSSGSRKGTLQERARAVIEAGFRAYRTAVDMPWSSQGGGKRHRHLQLPRGSQPGSGEGPPDIREGVGKDGDWLTDVHTRLDLADAVRLCALLEPFAPFEVEDPLRSENKGNLLNMRARIRVPIAVGEQFGNRWDINDLIEQRLIDYARVTPNTGGITEFMKIADLCGKPQRGHDPARDGAHFHRGSHAYAGHTSGPVLMECPGVPQPPYLPRGAELPQRQVVASGRPGLGVEFDPKGVDLLAEITEHAAPIPLYRRPDGSITNW